MGTRSSAIAEGCATRLSVKILQLQNIPFENNCNRQMTLKFIHQGHRNCCFYVGCISRPVSGLLLQCLYLAPFQRYYHLWSERYWRWPSELLYFWQ